MQGAYELFLNGLRELLNCENRLVHVLGEAKRESAKYGLGDVFQQHRRVTQRQAARLLEIFREIGEQPEQADCHGIQGLIEEKEAFLKKDPSHELLDFFNVAACIKIERYEISAYEIALLLAQKMRMEHAAHLLKQMLDEEREAFQKLQHLLGEVKLVNLGVREQPEGGIPRKAA